MNYTTHCPICSNTLSASPHQGMFQLKCSAPSCGFRGPVGNGSQQVLDRWTQVVDTISNNALAESRGEVRSFVPIGHHGAKNEHGSTSIAVTYGIHDTNLIFEVAYPDTVSPATLALTFDQYEEVLALTPDKKIGAVILLRTYTGCGLKVGKRIVEILCLSTVPEAIASHIAKARGEEHTIRIGLCHKCVHRIEGETEVTANGVRATSIVGCKISARANLGKNCPLALRRD